MDDERDIRLVVAHPERGCRHEHLAIIVETSVLQVHAIAVRVLEPVCAYDRSPPIARSLDSGLEPESIMSERTSTADFAFPFATLESAITYSRV